MARAPIASESWLVSSLLRTVVLAAAVRRLAASCCMVRQ